MPFHRELQHLLAMILIGFALVAVTASYWALVGRDSLLAREDNPRLVEAAARVQRGALYDRHGTLLARTRLDASGRARREVLQPALNSALGYFSLRYGTAGAEAAFDAWLSGAALSDGLAARFAQDVLHRPPRGVDLRLSFDTRVQKHLVTAMGGVTGAAVVLSVPDGEMLALVSLPTFDANSLDENWPQLVADPGEPFFNRALQGRYQPGGVLQTPLMAAVLLAEDETALNTVTADANAAVQAGETRLTCAVTPPRSDLTLRDAYAYGCPRPFALLSDTLGDTLIHSTLDAFRIGDPPTLPGYIAAPPDNPADITPEATPQLNNVTLRETLLGQGRETITPLGAASLVAAVLNDGNAPEPHTLLALRPPGESDWQSHEPLLLTRAMMTRETAQRLRDLMRYNVSDGGAKAADRAGLDVGGHVALAYAGDSVQTWFVGFVALNGAGAPEGAVVALLLENRADPVRAASLGGLALDAAWQSLR